MSRRTFVLFVILACCFLRSVITDKQLYPGRFESPARLIEDFPVAKGERAWRCTTVLLLDLPRRLTRRRRRTESAENPGASPLVQKNVVVRDSHEDEEKS